MSIIQNKTDVEHNRLMAALGYVGVLCFVPLFFKKGSGFAQWHAKQGLAILAMEIIAFVLPLVLWPLFLLGVYFSLHGISKALHGKYWRLPLISKFIEKFS